MRVLPASLLLAALLLFAPAAWAQGAAPLAPADRAAIAGVITG